MNKRRRRHENKRCEKRAIKGEKREKCKCENRREENLDRKNLEDKDKT